MRPAISLEDVERSGRNRTREVGTPAILLFLGGIPPTCSRGIFLEKGKVSMCAGHQIILRHRGEGDSGPSHPSFRGRSCWVVRTLGSVTADNPWSVPQKGRFEPKVGNHRPQGTGIAPLLRRTRNDQELLDTFS